MTVLHIRYSEIEKYRQLGYSIGQKAGSGLYEVSKADDCIAEILTARLDRAYGHISELRDELTTLRKEFEEARDTANEVIRGLQPVESDLPVTMARIAQVVCQEFGVTMSELRSTRRQRKYARPRQVAYWLADYFTSHSLMTIGDYMRRDHTTVMYGIRKVAQLRSGDERFRAMTDALVEKIKSGGAA